jgi:hypothetical protein
MAGEFDKWNGTMLAENRVKASYNFGPAQLADHYNPFGVPQAGAAAAAETPE